MSRVGAFGPEADEKTDGTVFADFARCRAEGNFAKRVCLRSALCRAMKKLTSIANASRIHEQ